MNEYAKFANLSNEAQAKDAMGWFRLTPRRIILTILIKDMDRFVYHEGEWFKPLACFEQ